MASAAYHSVKKRMDGGEVILLDGAISTEIQKRGVPMDKLAWSGLGSKIGSETLLEVHKDYIRAGADVITTNTFSSARHSLTAAGQGEATREINAMAVSLAKQAVDEVSEGRTVLVAGSISPFGAYNEITGARGSTVRPPQGQLPRAGGDIGRGGCRSAPAGDAEGRGAGQRDSGGGSGDRDTGVGRLQQRGGGGEARNSEDRILRYWTA